MQEFRRDHALLVLAQELDEPGVHEVGAVAAHQAVVGYGVLHVLHRGAEHEFLDAVGVHVADDHVVGVGLDADDRGRVDRELEPLVLVVELHQRLGRLRVQVRVLVEDDLDQDQEHVGIDQDQVRELEAEGEDGEVVVAAALEERRVERHEEGRDEHLAEAPDGIVPPQEGDVLVERAEYQAGKRQDGHQDGGEHDEVETEAHAAGLVVLLHAEGVVQEAESNEKCRNQHNIKQL